MQIRSSDLDILPDDPFKNDELERRELEPPLTQFVTQAVGPFVLAVDGSWGSGKTTFLKMWQVKLNEAGHLCLYLNAWKTDFVQDPLVAVVGELSSAIEDPRLDNDNVRRTIAKVEKTAKSIFKRIIPTVVKIATVGAVSDSQIEKTIADFTSETAQDLIKDYNKGKSDIEEFRESLSFLAAAIRESNNESSKIVIVVDELDRCRPTYAVQLLERIKHVFDVEGVVFILGIDRHQLSHSVKALYGSEFDATGYLKRFIDQDYRLPDPSLGCYCSYLLKKFEIDTLLSKRQLLNNGNDLNDFNHFDYYLGYLMCSAKMSLRDQEQIISRLRIVLQTITVKEKPFPVTLSILLFLRNYIDPKIYTSVIAGNLTAKDFLVFIEALPNEKKAFQSFSSSAKSRNYSGFFKERIEGVFLAGLNELSNTICPEMQKYMEVLNLRENSSHEVEWILEIANQERLGFQKTEQRLNLISNFEQY
jgi:KAP family P-loop domain